MFNRRSVLRGALATPAVLLASRLGAASGQGVSDYGVASGDPRADSVILWTRVPESFQAPTVTVTYEVSRTQNFDVVLAAGFIDTDASRDYTVKVRVSGLSPFTRYYYRFTSNTGYASVVGRTLTAPAPGTTPPQPLRFAYVSCQNFSEGFYTVFAAMAADDLDYCVHLGDNIYETASEAVRVDPVTALDLASYRAEYKLLLSDPNYREVRRLFPWIHLWDDHEVFNNYAGTTLDAAGLERQRAGYRAFLEYLPVEVQPEAVPATGAPNVTVYRRFPFGNLVELFVLDERQYRDGLVCETDFFLGTQSCPELFDPARTMLGATQKAWLKQGLADSGARWKVLLSELMVMGFLAVNLDPQVRTPRVPPFFDAGVLTDRGLYINIDAWDGYPAERTELLQFIKDNNIANVGVWTGDIHNCYAGVLRPDFNAPDTPAVAVEVVGGSVSSNGLFEILGNVDLSDLGLRVLRRANPHIQYVDLRYHVYTRVTFTPLNATYEYRAVEAVTEETSAAFTLKRFVVPNGQARLIES
jgi:alkaline phosphatase D